MILCEVSIASCFMVRSSGSMSVIVFRDQDCCSESLDGCSAVGTDVGCLSNL